MNILTCILAIFLVLGLLGVQNSVFAHEPVPAGPNCILQCSASTFIDSSSTPLLKGGGRGGRGGGRRGGSSSRGSGDDDSNSYSNSSTSGNIGGLPIFLLIIFILPILVPIVILGIFGFLIWRIFFKK